jgi:diguanylate cyclase (GGDEF)-like protein
LTEVKNRHSFNQYLDTEWRRLAREEAPLSLIMCDIDYFKIYNDTYGHQAGDECLRAVAQTIRQSLQRPTDVAARYGGEEFAVILPQTDAASALLVAEHIRVKVKDLKIFFKPERFDGLPNCVVTISLGIASVVPGQENDAATLVLAADEALYHSKRQGRDRLTMSRL